MRGEESGRTIYSLGGPTEENCGHDAHPHCFTKWMARGGEKLGTNYGETDDFSQNKVKDLVQIHDSHAKVLHPLGLEHEEFAVHDQSLDRRLIGTRHQGFNRLNSSPATCSAVR